MCIRRADNNFVSVHRANFTRRSARSGWTTSLSVRLARLNDLGAATAVATCGLIFLNNGESLAKANARSAARSEANNRAAEANRARRTREDMRDTFPPSWRRRESFRFRREWIAHSCEFTLSAYMHTHTRTHARKHIQDLSPSRNCVL